MAGGGLPRPVVERRLCPVPRPWRVVRRGALRARFHRDGRRARHHAHRRLPAPHRRHRQRMARPDHGSDGLLHRRRRTHLHRQPDREAGRHQPEEPAGRDRGRRAEAHRPACKGGRYFRQGPRRHPARRQDRHGLHVHGRQWPVCVEHLLHESASGVGHGVQRREARRPLLQGHLGAAAARRRLRAFAPRRAALVQPRRQAPQGHG